jgi:hypothetical protein
MARWSLGLGVKLHLGPQTRLCYCQTAGGGLLMWSTYSNDETCLSFTTAAGPHRCSPSWVHVPRGSWPYITVSDSRLPQPGGPGSHIYIPQGQGGPVIPLGTGYPFWRLLRFKGLWWRYSNLLPHKCDWLQSESELLHNGQFTANRFILAHDKLSFGGGETEPLWS